MMVDMPDDEFRKNFVGNFKNKLLSIKTDEIAQKMKAQDLANAIKEMRTYTLQLATQRIKSLKL